MVKRKTDGREVRLRKRERGFPHLHRQCLTSVAVARPPRDESITLNNVNVSPSQHKTNNHCSLPRPMGMASSRGSPVPHSPPASACFHYSSAAPLRSPVSLFLFLRSSLRPRLRGLIKKSPLARGRLRFNLRIAEGETMVHGLQRL